MAKVGVRHLGRDGETIFFYFFCSARCRCSTCAAIASRALSPPSLEAPQSFGTCCSKRICSTARYRLRRVEHTHTQVARTSLTHASLTHKSHAHISHSATRFPNMLRSTHFRIVVCHRMMLFHCFLSRLSHFPVYLSRHVFPATCHTPQIPPLKSASTWTFFFFFCLFSCLFSCLQIGNLPNKCVFFRPPTHFSHMSHPTFPIFHVLMSPDWQPSQARWPLG